jgi:hypothetical protein
MADLIYDLRDGPTRTACDGRYSYTGRILSKNNPVALTVKNLLAWKFYDHKEGCYEQLNYWIDRRAFSTQTFRRAHHVHEIVDILPPEELAYAFSLSITQT